MYTTKEVCEQVGISYETLKFYCQMSKEIKITIGSLMKRILPG